MSVKNANAPYPAPESNLGEQDVAQILDEITKYMELFEPSFQRVEQLEWSKAYLHGLLGNAMRKNVEQMALGMGENVRSMQYFIGQSPWKTEPVTAIHQRLVAETLREADGVILIDESGVVNKAPTRWVSPRNVAVRLERSPTVR